MLRPLVQPGIRTSHRIAQRLTPGGLYLLATGPHPAQVLLGVGDGGAGVRGYVRGSYGSFLPDSLGGVQVNIFVATTGDLVTLRMVGDVQIPGITKVTLYSSSADNFWNSALTWNAVDRYVETLAGSYDAVDAALGGSLQFGVVLS